ncbi:MAG TPA: AI-2E family transporter [Longimicrobium sp.]|nr:AI-2E family transporter [Longimicrobium sp.]
MTEPRHDTPAPAPAPGRARGDRVRTAAVVVIATGVTFAALYLGRVVFVPLALSLVFAALLRPMVRWLAHHKVPLWGGATLAVLLSILVIAGAAVAVVAPMQSFAKQAPTQIEKAKERLRTMAHVLDPVLGGGSSAGQTGGGSKAQSGSQQGGAASERGGSPGLAVPGVANRIFGMTTSLLTGLLEVLLLVWFLLASGELFMRKLVHVIPAFSDKKRAVEVVHETEAAVSRYMLVSLLMYLAEGALVWLTAWLVGLPTPMLWGVLTVLLEFVPYLGGALMTILLTIVGLATFDSLGQALIAPGVYLVLSAIQNNFASAFAYGRGLKLNPVAVLVAVMIWYAMWGIPGAFLAVPIIAAAKVLADHTPSLSALGEFLGE